MGFFRKLFGGTAPPTPPHAALENAITQLELSILTKLITGYAASVGPRNAVLLGASVVAEAVREPLINAEEREYCESHSALVREEALKLGQNPEVADALSYLYAAKRIYFAFMTRNLQSVEVQRLGAAASELGIYISSTYDVGGSADPIDCIRTIAEFARKYKQQTFGE
jgi:hypothetical protein